MKAISNIGTIVMYQYIFSPIKKESKKKSFYRWYVINYIEFNSMLFIKLPLTTAVFLMVNSVKHWLRFGNSKYMIPMINLIT